MLLMISMPWKRVTRATLNLGYHLCKGEVGPLQNELNNAQFLLSSYRTKCMFMAKINIKVRTGKC